MSPQTATKYTPLLLRALVACGVLYFLFSHLADAEQVRQLLRNAQPPWLVLALFLGISGEILTAYKWRLLVSQIGGQLPILKTVRVSFIGMFYNNFFPGSVGGDIIRVLMISPNAGGKARAAASTFMQRNTGLAALFAVGVPAAVIWPQAFGWNGASGPDHAGLNCLVVLLLAGTGYLAANLVLFNRQAYAFLWKLLHNWMHAQSGNYLSRILRKLITKLQRFHTELHGFRFWRWPPLMTSLLTQLTDIFMVWTLAQALHLPIGFTTLMCILPVISVLNLLPLTINGIGTRELMYISLLASHGISAEQAISLSLLHLGMILTLAAIGGIIQLIPSPSEAAPASLP